MRQSPRPETPDTPKEGEARLKLHKAIRLAVAAAAIYVAPGDALAQRAKEPQASSWSSKGPKMKARPIEHDSISEILESGTHAPKLEQFMKTYGPAELPDAFLDFCRRVAEACEKQNLSAGEMMRRKREGDSVDILELESVNDEVNTGVLPKTDWEQHGVSDRWDIAKIGGFGDCEDYVLLKRQKLIEKGWRPSDLLVTVVRDKNDEGHAVLTVRTKKADFVLDLHKGVFVWSELRDGPKSYTYVSRQSYQDPKVWVSLMAP